MSWKQVKIFVSDATQAVIIQPNVQNNGILFRSIEEEEEKEEEDKKSFMLYMTYKEAEIIGKELIRYAKDMKSNSI